MFYLVEVEDHVRVEPSLFGLDTDEAVKQQLHKTYSDFIDKDLGAVIDVLEVMSVDDGIIIPGDGAAYYKSRFKLVVFRPELQELVYGTIDEITNFGAFFNMGVLKGMIHISQTMDDFVSFSNTGSLQGRDSKRNLVIGDNCLARVVAISHKGELPKVGLTMRQPGLGKIEWVNADKDKEKAEQAKALKAEAAAAKKKGGKK
jgi:DNA-directed RNA polymerase subunit E'